MIMRNDWHLVESGRVVNELGSDMFGGLGEREAAKRRLKNGQNGIWRVRRSTGLEAVLSAVFDLSTLLLIVCAVAAAFYEKDTEAFAMIAVLLVGGTLRAVTYIKADRVFEGLAKEKIPMMNVIRGGVMKNISSADAVVGDIIFLRAGDTVPCDGRVLSSSDAVVSEKGVTENKEPVHKFDTVIKTKDGGGEVPCEFRSNMLFAGSVVISGNTRMIATATGDGSLVSMKQGGFVIEPENQLPMIKKLEAKSKITALIMLGCVMVFTFLSLVIGRASYADMFLGTMAMAVAAMSEFLPVVAYIASAVLIHRLGKAPERKSEDGHKKAKRGAVKILTPSKLDKISSTDIAVFSGTSFFKSGTSSVRSFFSRGEVKTDRASLAELLSLMTAAAQADESSLSSGQTPQKSESEYSLTVKKASCAYSLSRDGKPIPKLTVLDRQTYSDSTVGAELDLSIAAIGDEAYILALGGLGEIMSLCSYVDCADGAAILTDEKRRAIFVSAARSELGGAKLAAVAKRPSPFTSLTRIPTLLTGMTFVGFISLSDEAEAGAAESVKYLRAAGIAPVIFSRNPEADFYFCHSIGLVGKRCERIKHSELTSADIERAGENGLIVSFEGIDQLSVAVAYAEASGRIKELSGEDRTVSFLGREITDSGAMRAADVAYTSTHAADDSIPQILIKGADAAVYPAPMYAEKGYGGLHGFVKTLATAAQMIHNINHASLYLTASQCARFVLIFSSLLFDIPMLSPVFILIVGLLFDFAAVVAISFTRHTKAPDLHEKLRPYSLYPLVSGAVWGAVLLLVPLLSHLLASIMPLRVTDGEVLSVASAAVVLTGLVYVFATEDRGKRKLSNAECIFAVFAVLLAVSALALPPFVSVIGGEVCKGKALLLMPLSLVAPAVEAAVLFITKKVRGRGSKASLKSEKTPKKC